MKINILSVGALKDDEKNLFNKYLKRIKSYKVNNIELTDKVLQNKKNVITDNLFKSLKPDSILIALDQRGKDLTSEQLQELVEGYNQTGIKELNFAIGGSLGFDQSVIKRANNVIKFGNITMPHKLVKIILIEQIYRVQCLTNNHPYHK